MNEAADRASAPVVGLTDEFPPERTLARHSHRKGQLLYATEGVMHLHAPEGVWVLPPQRALWIPPGLEHGFSCRRTTRVLALWAQPDAIRLASDRCRVVDAHPLLRELIRRAVTLDWSYAPGSPADRLVGVLIDELSVLEAAPLDLPMPSDNRALRVCHHLQRRPGDPRSLPQHALAVGTSKRTLARLFAAETGLTFGAWRQRLRMQLAVERLAEGSPVTTVALDLGYATVNGFIDTFRGHFGVTPGRYFAHTGTAFTD